MTRDGALGSGDGGGPPGKGRPPNKGRGASVSGEPSLAGVAGLPPWKTAGVVTWEIQADGPRLVPTPDIPASEREGSPELGKESSSWWPWRPSGQASPSEPVRPQVPVAGGSRGAPGLLLQEPVLSCVPHRHAQEVSRLCHLSAGTYRIVPSTYLPDTEGAFTVTIATRIDRWGSRAGRSSVYGVHRPVVASAPPAPALTRPRQTGRGARQLAGARQESAAAPRAGGSRATLSSPLQALHSQPGEAGAAPSGGRCGAWVRARPVLRLGAAFPQAPPGGRAAGRSVPWDTGTLVSCQEGREAGAAVRPGQCGQVHEGGGPPPPPTARRIPSCRPPSWQLGKPNRVTPRVSSGDWGFRGAPSHGATSLSTAAAARARRSRRRPRPAGQVARGTAGAAGSAQGVSDPRGWGRRASRRPCTASAPGPGERPCSRREHSMTNLV